MHNLEFTKTTNSLSVLENIERFFREKQTEAYLVGGFVRDTLLGRETADIDVAVSKDVMLIAPELAQAVQGRFFLLDKVNRIVRITSSPEDQKPDREQWHIDLSSFTGDVKQDLARRDFSVDALAVEFNKLIDMQMDSRLG